MNNRTFFCLSMLVFLITACGAPDKKEEKALVIGNGQMPDIAGDTNGNIYIVYGSGDSILYASSVDGGESYSDPVVVGILPELAASHMRGPQIAMTATGISITAYDKAGNIFLYNKEKKGNWLPAYKLNDVDTVAKEGLMDLYADGDNMFAVWLDLRDSHNKIFGAGSADGGKTWAKNKLVYASPDTTVCECCKPSVYVKGNHVYVMFRNWLKGNRDLYLVQSVNGGENFGEAQKLGAGNWALNGCPMDGGGISVQDNGVVQTVWRRQNKIYSCEPGKPEVEIGEGKSCTLALVNNKAVYAWTENGLITILSVANRRALGKGRSAVIKPAGKDKVACVWENENRIYSEIISL